jgi:hypothetical protein
LVETRIIACQSSWILRSRSVEMAITQLGGHMAPVHFYLDDAPSIQPYCISPWQCEQTTLLEGRSEVPLRGDFFCMPFGGGKPYLGEDHPAHGHTSGGRWSLVDAGADGPLHTLTVAMDTITRPGKVTRSFSLLDGENVIYDQTRIDGFAGKTTLGHHAVLIVPGLDRSLLITTSRMKFGMTYPLPFGDPAEGEYQSLAVGAQFDDLSRVPSIFKGKPDEDCSRYPARRGFTDLFQIVAEPISGEPAWITAVNVEAGYLWFALKDPAMLPSTIFWIENRGRHSSPWNGRTSLLGLEDVCAYFDAGIAASSEANCISDRGVPTCHELRGKAPLTIHYIQGVVRLPPAFRRVHAARFRDNEVNFIDESGIEVAAHVQPHFVFAEPLRYC